MRLVRWTDEQGYDHNSLIRDRDPDSAAPSGIPQDPPDLSQIDWADVKRELYNELVGRGLITWRDVEAQQVGVTAAIVSVLRRRVTTLYRIGAKESES